MSNESLSDISDGTMTNQMQQSQVDRPMSRSSSFNLDASPRVSMMQLDKTEEDMARPKKSLKTKTKSSIPENSFMQPTSVSNLFMTPCKKSLSKGNSVPNFIELNKKSLSEFSDLVKHSRDAIKPQSSSILRKHMPNVKGRLYESRKKSEQKILSQQLQAREAEVKDCTFTPSINPSKQQRRSSEQFFQDMLRFEVKKRNHLKHLQEIKGNTSQETFPFKPSICEKSNRILSSKEYTTIQCHERLYEMHRVRVNKMASSSWFLDDMSRDFDSNNTFTHVPRISKMAKNLRRVKPVDQLLYEDAQRRLIHEEPEIPSNVFSPSAFSIRILVRSFLREFDACVSPYLAENSVNYSSYVRTLKALRMIGLQKTSEENVLVLKLWAQLGGDEGRVTLKDLRVAMMGVMGYFQPWMESSESFSLTQTELLKFHDRYLLLFENRATTPPEPKEPQPKVVEETESLVTVKEEKSSSSIELKTEPMNKKSMGDNPAYNRRQSSDSLNSIGIFANAIKVNLAHTQNLNPEQKRFSLVGLIGGRLATNDPAEGRSNNNERAPRKSFADIFPSFFQDKTESDNNMNSFLPDSSFCVQDLSDNVLKIEESEESDEPEPILIDVNVKNTISQLLIKDTSNVRREVNKFAIENNLGEEEERKLLVYAEECIKNSK